MKKLTTVMTVLAMAGAAQVASATPFSDAVDALSPVGYWQYENDWTDSTAGGNTLTPFGTAAFTLGPGLPGLSGDAGDFRHAGGQNGAYVATGGASALNLSGATAYTINAWVSNDEDIGSWGMIAVERDTIWASGWNYGSSHYRSSGGPTSGYRAWTQGGLASAEGLALIDAGWHMLTVSAILGGVANFYVDGAFVGSAGVSGTIIAGDGAWFNVANNANPNTADWGPSDLNGRIDELAVFSTALSAPQIEDLYTAATVLAGPVIIGTTNVVVDDVLGTSFSSMSGATHRLQSAPDLVSSNFSDTGAMAIGTGGGMTLFDPTGPSTSKAYRVTQE